MIDDIKMEREVAKCKATLLKELKAAYAQLQKDGNWEDFGQRVRGIYISYSTCDNEVFHRAMRDVLAGATRETLPDDLIAGNYGLKVQAENVASEEIELLKDMKERYGVNVMRRFLNSFNVCQTYAVCMVTEDRKKVKKQFEELVETLVNISSF